MKKTAYILLTTTLGILFSFILHALIEVLYLDWASQNNIIVQWRTIWGKSCALDPILSISLLAVGLLVGIWLGFRWWDSVYNKRKRGLFLKVK